MDLGKFTTIGEIVFTADDQLWFAALSQDLNPIHVDPIFARRTLAGEPIVHGIHALIWLLDAAACSLRFQRCVAALKIQFARFMYVGEKLVARAMWSNTKTLRIQIISEKLTVLDGYIEFDSTNVVSFPEWTKSAASIERPIFPVERSIHDLISVSGAFALSQSGSSITEKYPHALSLLGEKRINAIIDTSFLVGMVVPGKHSLYYRLSVQFADQYIRQSEFLFRVSSVRPTFSRIGMEVFGGGMFGSIECFIRPSPVPQPGIRLLRGRIKKREFSEAEVLIIGGSRGLGELTAQMLCAGGARVAITFVTGKSDAEDVVSRITATGGICRAVFLDVRGSVEDTIASLDPPAQFVYYFAAPLISRRRAQFFSQRLLDEFNAYFVGGFEAVVRACTSVSGGRVAFFYPSTIQLDCVTSGSPEYMMSKAAGEILCAAISERYTSASIVAQRLPRLLTDQTTGLRQSPTADSIETMLSIIRQVQTTLHLS